MHLASLVPRPVRIMLGGCEWLAAEYRISDLADFQEWINCRSGSPYELHAFELHYSDPTVEWKRLLRKVLVAQESWPPDIADSCDDPESEIFQVYLCLRRHTPGFDLAQARSIIESARQHPVTLAHDLSRLFRVAWAVDPMRVLLSLVDGPSSEIHDPPDWGVIYHRYLTEASGSAPRFEDLTLSQFRAWATKGKSSEENRSDYMEVAQRRAAFWAGVD